MIQIQLEGGDVSEVFSNSSCASVALERNGNFWTLLIEAHGDVKHSCEIAIGSEGAWIVEAENCSIISPEAKESNGRTEPTR